MNFETMANTSTIIRSTEDPTSKVAHTNALRGFSMILSCLDEKDALGNNSRLITLPDYTYTRNNNRWNAGFSNGYILHLDSQVPFIPVGFRPNCCGIIISKIGEFNYKKHEFEKFYRKAIKNIADVNTEDLSRMNHFLAIYKEPNTGVHYALLHCSFNFVKKGYGELSGLSIDECKSWAGKLQTHHYNDDELKYLIGDDALEYYDNYTKLEKLSRDKREIIMSTLFPNSKTKFSEVHQGFFNINTILLGAYASNEPFKCPIMLKEDKPLPYVSVEKPIKIGDISFYCAPHGCGYKIKKQNKEGRKISTHSGLIYIEDKIGNEIVTSAKDPFNVNFEYRDNAHILWCDEFKMGKIENEYIEVANLKIH